MWHRLSFGEGCFTPYITMHFCWCRNGSEADVESVTHPAAKKIFMAQTFTSLDMWFSFQRIR